MKPPLADTDKQLLRFIAKHILRFGFQPSYHEIASHFRWRSGPTAVRRRLVRLESAGYVLLNRDARAVSFHWRRWLPKRRRNAQ